MIAILECTWLIMSTLIVSIIGFRCSVSLVTVALFSSWCCMPISSVLSIVLGVDVIAPQAAKSKPFLFCHYRPFSFFCIISKITAIRIVWVCILLYRKLFFSHVPFQIKQDWISLPAESEAEPISYFLKLWLFVSHAPFSLYHHSVLIWFDCFSVMILIHFIS